MPCFPKRKQLFVRLGQPRTNAAGFDIAIANRGKTESGASGLSIAAAQTRQRDDVTGAGPQPRLGWIKAPAGPHPSHCGLARQTGDSLPGLEIEELDRRRHLDRVFLVSRRRQVASSIATAEIRDKLHRRTKTIAPQKQRRIEARRLWLTPATRRAGS